MGQGMAYECSKCKREYDVFVGSGMMYPRVYKKTVDAAMKGEYGEEWQQLMTKEKYMDIDAESGLYMCGCGNWIVDKDLSVYAPFQKEEEIENKQYGDKTVKEWGYVPYVMKHERFNDYYLVKTYAHTCDKCGGLMSKVDEEQIGSLRCPKCKTVNNPLGTINWD